jgi:hypothetical protein
VPFNGEFYHELFVGSNGYITFGEGDVSWGAALTSHFSKKRISVLFTDLNPSAAGAVVRWTEKPHESVIVSWQNVPAFADSTRLYSFQVRPDCMMQQRSMRCSVFTSYSSFDEKEFALPWRRLNFSLMAESTCGGCGTLRRRRTLSWECLPARFRSTG